ncbi:MAG: sugar phosphate isomerase/epimerase [Candidatus Sumerlaeota bacterium]|nr:sugar phosphate isomerase/epimerase [Candidatus Sumerlaeota bacterium]
MAFQIGCQTITFGAEQKDHFPEVFSAVAKAGFQGVEIGFRHIAAIPPAELKKLLAKSGLALAGSHIGGNLEDVAQAESEKKVLENILDYLNAMGVEFLMYSGLKYQNDKQFAADLAMVNRSAAACRARGVTMCYHNHAWEFADNWKVMKPLIRAASSDLFFCPDVGWVHRGGADVIEFLEAVKDRIAYVHFKDFHPGEKVDFALFGEGEVPLKKIAQWLQRNRPGLWIVAEQDRAAIPANQAVAKNGAFLRAVFGG